MESSANISGPLDIQQIIDFLPHRAPFVLVDRVLALDPAPPGNNYEGRKIHALKNVTYNEPFFPGHFPGMPIMPGVMILEALAQTAALVGGRKIPGKKIEVIFVGLDDVRFRAPVFPGDTLHLYAEVLRDRGSIQTFSVEAKVEGKTVAEAEIIARQRAI